MEIVRQLFFEHDWNKEKAAAMATAAFRIMMMSSPVPCVRTTNEIWPVADYS
jgi:hypothetical protein